MTASKVIDTLSPKHDASKRCIVSQNPRLTQQLGLEFGLNFLHTFMLKRVNSNFVFLDCKDVTFDKQGKLRFH